MTDQFAAYKTALKDGTAMDMGPRDNPSSGYFRMKITRDGKSHFEAIGIWRGNDGVLVCRRSMTKTPSTMTPEDINRILEGSRSLNPIPYAVYIAVMIRKEPWPPEYLTELTIAEIQAGVVWTPELGKRKLTNASAIDAQAVEVEAARQKAMSEPKGVTVIAGRPAGYDSQAALDATKEKMKAAIEANKAENPRAVAGDNQPPEETPKTESQLLCQEIKALSFGVKTWLEQIGGKIVTQAQADWIADYATKFQRASAEAVAKHKVEKAPVLEHGKEIDAKWFPLRDTATEKKGRCLELAKVYLAAETKKREEIARAEAAKLQRLEDERVTRARAAGLDTKRETIEPEKIESVKIGTLRTVSARKDDTWQVTDRLAFVTYLLARKEPPEALIEVLEKFAQSIGPSAEKLGKLDTVPGIKKIEGTKAQ